jgi:hypothetical protein
VAAVTEVRLYSRVLRHSVTFEWGWGLYKDDEYDDVAYAWEQGNWRCACNRDRWFRDAMRWEQQSLGCWCTESLYKLQKLTHGGRVLFDVAAGCREVENQDYWTKPLGWPI